MTEQSGKRDVRRTQKHNPPLPIDGADGLTTALNSILHRNIVQNGCTGTTQLPISIDWLPCKNNTQRDTISFDLTACNDVTPNRAH